MPIYGMTRKLESEDAFVPRPICLGKIWLGQPKTETRPGFDLGEKMRFSSPTKWVEQKFIDIYGSLVVEKINFYFFYPTTEKSWDCSREEWAAGRGLVRKCNQQWIEREQVRIEGKDAKGNSTYSWRQKVYEPEEKPCPYAYDPKNPKPDCPSCSYSGRLSIYIREFYDAGIQGMVLLENHSRNNIPLLTDHLRCKEEELRAIGGDLCSSPVLSPETQGFIPWQLSRYQKSIPKPMTEKRGGKVVQTGDRTRGMAWLITCDIDSEWLNLMKERMTKRGLVLAAAPAEPELALPAASHLDSYRGRHYQGWSRSTIEQLQEESIPETEEVAVIPEVVADAELDLGQRRAIHRRVINTLQVLAKKPDFDIDKAKDFAKKFMQDEFNCDSVEILSIQEYLDYADRLDVRVSEISG